jgi:hypothetical protein
VEEKADKSGFSFDLLREVISLGHFKTDVGTSTELTRLLDEANQLVAITAASRKREGRRSAVCLIKTVVEREFVFCVSSGINSRK